MENVENTEINMQEEGMPVEENAAEISEEEIPIEESTEITSLELENIIDSTEIIEGITSSVLENLPEQETTVVYEVDMREITTRLDNIHYDVMLLFFVVFIIWVMDRIRIAFRHFNRKDG